MVKFDIASTVLNGESVAAAIRNGKSIVAMAWNGNPFITKYVMSILPLSWHGVVI